MASKPFRCIIVLSDNSEEVFTISGTSAGAKLTAQKLLAADPDHFKKLSKKAQKPRGGVNSVGSFKAGDPRAQEAGRRGGQASRRSSAKNQADLGTSAISRVDLPYKDVLEDD